MKAICLIVALAAAVQAAGGGDAPRRDLAILASAVLPGTGQMMLDSKVRGEAQLWLDGAIWVLWGGFSWYSSSQEQTARLYAAKESGVDLAIPEADYYRALERYDNTDEYNEDIRREARDRYPDDPEAQHDYYESHGYFGGACWNWSSDSARFDYWRTRKSGRAAALRAGFSAGALLLNRLISVVDCAFFAGTRTDDARIEIGSGSSLASVEVRYRF